MKATQDEHIPHQASLGPVVETKPIKWGWIEDKLQWGFTPEGNMSLDWIQQQLYKEITVKVEKPDIRILPPWFFDIK